MYETFEHTADLGLRARAADVNALFAEMGRALFSSLVADLGAVRPTVERRFALVGDEVEFLLFDWLSELLYVFEKEHLLFSDFEVQVDSAGLTGVARGEPLDRSRHALGHEVKAITYHELKVRRAGDHWLAEVIVDI